MRATSWRTPGASLRLVELSRAAEGAVKAEAWDDAVTALEGILALDKTDREAAARLRAARQRKELAGLAAEARQLHQAGKWEAVIAVFERIRAGDSAYPDPEGLLVSAQEGLAREQQEQRSGGALRAGPGTPGFRRPDPGAEGVRGDRGRPAGLPGHGAAGGGGPAPVGGGGRAEAAAAEAKAAAERAAAAKLAAVEAAEKEAKRAARQALVSVLAQVADSKRVREEAERKARAKPAVAVRAAAKKPAPPPSQTTHRRFR